MICKIIGGYMLAKTLVVFYVWSPDIFVLIVIITLFLALFILLCQIKHYHTIPYHTINLYYNLVFLYLISCNEVWGNASAVHLEPIIKIPNRAIRTITFSTYLSPSEPIFQSLNILNFGKLVIQRVSLLIFKLSKCDVPKPLHALFRMNNLYQTGKSESIHFPIGKTEAIYETFS